MDLIKTLLIVFVFLPTFFPGMALAGEVMGVAGDQLPGWAGVHIEQLRLYALSPSGEKRLIPFQVDEKIASTKKGGRRWALSQSGHAYPGDRRMDDDELLLFLMKDVGVLLHSPKFAGAGKVLEIQTDSTGGRGVYLVLEDKTDPVKKSSTASYIEYDAIGDQVETDAYQMGFLKKFPLVQNLLIPKNGSVKLDILDRFKTRFKISLKHLFDIKFHEEGIRSKLLGYKAGPIRVIRVVQAWKKLGFIKLIPKSRITFTFYPDWVEIKTQINNPVHGPKFLDENTQALSGFDFNRNLLGSLFFTSLGGKGEILDGKEGNQVFLSDKAKVRWWALNGLFGAIVVGVKNDPELARRRIYPRLVLQEDLQNAWPPESQKGGIFIGFDLPYHLFPKGRYRIRVKQTFPNSFMQGEEAEYLRRSALVKPTKIRPLP